MKANEFRIGNTIDVSGIICNITCLEEQRLTTDYQDHWYLGYDEIDPIPLTRKLLLKIGFENWGAVYPAETGLNTIRYVLHNVIDGTSNFEIHIDDNKFYPCVDNDACCWYDFKYVHQLQNLYYALTGHELTCKR